MKKCEYIGKKTYKMPKAKFIELKDKGSLLAGSPDGKETETEEDEEDQW